MFWFLMTQLPQLKSWHNSNFELDSVMYIQDIETTGEPVFSLA